jgi:hypothetical protein
VLAGLVALFERAVDERAFDAKAASRERRGFGLRQVDGLRVDRRILEAEQDEHDDAARHHEQHGEKPDISLGTGSLRGFARRRSPVALRRGASDRPLELAIEVGRRHAVTVASPPQPVEGKRKAQN